MKQKEMLKKTSIEISTIIKSFEYKIAHRKKSKFFTRKSELGFLNTIYMILNFFKKTSSLEVFNFFSDLLNKEKVPTRQAFEQSRAKISHTAFKELFQVTVKNALEAEDAKLYCGYRVLAIDGTTMRLENSDDLKEHFGETTPVAGQIFARISTTVDVLNKFIVSANIGDYHTSEHKMASANIDELNALPLQKSVITMDRGYWSPDLITKICDSGYNFLLRISRTACRFINESEENSGYYLLKHKGKTYSLRFYKFMLPSGEIETLVTNISYNAMNNKKLEKLYALRWGIETKYNELKSSLQIENITGKSVLVVKQDFYATVFLSNMIAFAKLEANEIIHEKRADSGNKYEYNLNINIAVGIFKNRFIKIMLEENPLKQNRLLNKIISDISKYVIPNKPNRHAKRKPNHKKPHKSMNRKTSL